MVYSSSLVRGRAYCYQGRQITERLQLIEICPGIGAIKCSDRNISGVSGPHYSRIDGYTAFRIFLDTFIMRGATTVLAVIELNTFVAPKVGCSCIGRTKDFDLLPRVVGPLHTQAVTDGAGAFRQ